MKRIDVRYPKIRCWRRILGIAFYGWVKRLELRVDIYMMCSLSSGTAGGKTKQASETSQQHQIRMILDKKWHSSHKEDIVLKNHKNSGGMLLTKVQAARIDFYPWFFNVAILAILYKGFTFHHRFCEAHWFDINPCLIEFTLHFHISEWQEWGYSYLYPVLTKESWF